MIKDLMLKLTPQKLQKYMRFQNETEWITRMSFLTGEKPELPVLDAYVVMPFDGMGIFYYDVPRQFDFNFATILGSSLTGQNIRYFKLNYCLSGRVEVFLSNKEKYAYLDPGMVAFDQNDPSVKLSFTKETYRGFGLYFNFELMSEQDREVLLYYGITKKACTALIERDKECFLGNASAEFSSIVEDLAFRIDDRSLSGIHARMQCTRLVYLLLNDDVQPLEKSEYATLGQRKIAEDARHRMLTDPSLHLTAENLAEELSCTAPTLKKYFRKVYGIPMYTFLQEVRMKRAQEILRTTKKSIAEIAEETGYTNTSKFCSLFKKTYGVTPLEYRRLHS